jgi:hypothetical protein
MIALEDIHSLYWRPTFQAGGVFDWEKFVPAPVIFAYIDIARHRFSLYIWFTDVSGTYLHKLLRMRRVGAVACPSAQREWVHCQRLRVHV